MNRAQYLQYIRRYFFLKKRQKRQQQIRRQQLIKRRRQQQQQHQHRPQTKHALLIGINYIGTRYALNGCINDINNMNAFLQKRDFLGENIAMVSDDLALDKKPTKPVILESLKRLLINSKSGDLLFFQYSGHGGQVRDRNGDETDGLDECIYSCDLKPIKDDELKQVIRQYMKRGTTLTCLMDSCNSGTALDLRFNSKNTRRMIKDARETPTPSNVYMLSGCRDNQTSADAWLNGAYSGAMTASFLAQYTASDSWLNLRNKMRHWLRQKKFSQIPQFSSGRNVNIRSKVRI